MNKLIVIGFLGRKKCYLNISKEEAIERYCIFENISEADLEDSFYDIDEIEFNDVFEVSGYLGDQMIIYKILQTSTGKYFDDHNKWSDKPRIYTRKSFAETSIKQHSKWSYSIKEFKNLEDVRIVEEEYILISEKFYKPFEKEFDEQCYHSYSFPKIY